MRSSFVFIFITLLFFGNQVRSTLIVLNTQNDFTNFPTTLNSVSDANLTIQIGVGSFVLHSSGLTLQNIPTVTTITIFGVSTQDSTLTCNSGGPGLVLNSNALIISVQDLTITGCTTTPTFSALSVKLYGENQNINFNRMNISNNSGNGAIVVIKYPTQVLSDLVVLFNQSTFSNNVRFDQNPPTKFPAFVALGTGYINSLGKGPQLYLYDCVIKSNSAVDNDAMGGFMYADSINLRIEKLQAFNNVALLGYGGFAYLSHSYVYIADSLFSNHYTKISGGVVYNYYCDFYMYASNLTQNSAGVGIASFYNSNLSFVGTNFYNNTANGGDIKIFRYFISLMQIIGATFPVTYIIKGSYFKNIIQSAADAFIKSGSTHSSTYGVIIEDNVFMNLNIGRHLFALTQTDGSFFIVRRNIFKNLILNELIPNCGIIILDGSINVTGEISGNSFETVYSPAGIIKIWNCIGGSINIFNNDFLNTGYISAPTTSNPKALVQYLTGTSAIGYFGVIQSGYVQINVVNCSFINGFSSGSPVKTLDVGNGAVSVKGSSLNMTLTDSIFDGNYADVNGAAMYFFELVNSIVSVKDVLMKNNKAYSNGGAIYIENSSQNIMKFSSISFIGNNALLNGGAFGSNSIALTTEASFEKMTFTNNYALMGGGVAYFTNRSYIPPYFLNESFRNFTSLNNSAAFGNSVATDPTTLFIQQQSSNVSLILSGNALPTINVLLLDDLGQQIQTPETAVRTESFVLSYAYFAISSNKNLTGVNASSIAQWGVEASPFFCPFWQGECEFSAIHVAGYPGGSYMMNIKASVSAYSSIVGTTVSFPFIIEACPSDKITVSSTIFLKYPICRAPVCTNVCQNGGSCVGDNVCTCETGYMGSDCSQLVIMQRLDELNEYQNIGVEITAAIILTLLFSCTGIILLFKNKAIFIECNKFTFICLILGPSISFVSGFPLVANSIVHECVTSVILQRVAFLITFIGCWSLINSELMKLGTKEYTDVNSSNASGSKSGVESLTSGVRLIFGMSTTKSKIDEKKKSESQPSIATQDKGYSKFTVGFLLIAYITTTALMIIMVFEAHTQRVGAMYASIVISFGILSFATLGHKIILLLLGKGDDRQAYTIYKQMSALETMGHKSTTTKLKTTKMESSAENML
ncbi:hypothetical protein HK096_011274 [Nowakowskiella sp. JEL0078]|nr:hypothetical protein HK096_011274 [Nowakowskiella sp. JEL0078]